MWLLLLLLLHDHPESDGSRWLGEHGAHSCGQHPKFEIYTPHCPPCPQCILGCRICSPWATRLSLGSCLL